jgi:hypothetical protein
MRGWVCRWAGRQCARSGSRAARRTASADVVTSWASAGPLRTEIRATSRPPARPGHPGGARREQPGGHCTGALVVTERGVHRGDTRSFGDLGRRYGGVVLGGPASPKAADHGQKLRHRLVPPAALPPSASTLASTRAWLGWPARPAPAMRGDAAQARTGRCTSRGGVTGPLLVCGNHRQNVRPQAHLHPHPGRQPPAPRKITRAGGAPGSHRPSR